MASIVFTDCTTWIHGFDFTGESNKLTLSTKVEEKDTTVFGGGGFRSRVGGLKTVSASLAGNWSTTGTPSTDSELFAALGVADRAVTISPTGQPGSVAYLHRAGQFAYTPLDAGVGDLAPFSAEWMNSDPFGLIRGQVAAAKQVVSATGALGSVVQLGAPTSTQYVYAALHVFVAGATITVQIQSDDNAGMTTPITRGTIGPIVAASGTWLTRVAGPFAGETHWRANVSAITGSHIVAAAIAVQ